MSRERPTVLVLGGGPDAEREVSLQSSRAVADAVGRAGGRFAVNYQVIGRIDAPTLASLEGDVVFPVLHGAFGEGGPLQDLLEADARPYVGCGPRAARLAMDKLATKLLGARMGIPTAESAVVNLSDPVCPLAFPVVVKPVHEGSSVGLHICRDDGAWTRARHEITSDRSANPDRVYLVERYIQGRELTVGLLDGEALEPIEITAASGVYDYQAKYTRDDTQYHVGPDLPSGVRERVRRQAAELFRGLHARHLARIDFLLDSRGVAWLLEANTMPGFTSHSLLPMAARHFGLEMPALCSKLVDMALRDHARPLAAASA